VVQLGERPDPAASSSALILRRCQGKNGVPVDIFLWYLS